MSMNPPPLASPLPGLDVRAVLDQDEALTAGLAYGSDGERNVLLVSNQDIPAWQREEFLAWGRALSDAADVAPIARIVGYGVTDDGRVYLASSVTTSLADHLRLIGQPAPQRVRGMGATIADALATIHSYGLVHGAVSPATVLLPDRGVRLGGFGATAPGLSGPGTIWAFTAPEHRSAAASGSEVGTPAGDVFALAATICVALAGVLPWSDPTTWADAAAVPSGSDAPPWATILRSALSADPDRRPSAEEFASALRLPGAEPSALFHHAKVDLRGLIPRSARRLAATSIDAMADAVMPARGRAVAPKEDVPLRRTRNILRNNRMLAGLGVVVLLTAVAITSYRLSTPDPKVAAGQLPAVGGSAPPNNMVAIMEGARTEAQTFLHQVGSDDAAACTLVHGTSNILAPQATDPIDCTELMKNAKTLLSATLRDGLQKAEVLQAVGIASGDLNGQNDGTGVQADQQAFVSIAYVPSLAPSLEQMELTLDYHDGQWFVIQFVMQ
jgi:hypothetical protein